MEDQTEKILVRVPSIYYTVEIYTPATAKIGWYEGYNFCYPIYWRVSRLPQWMVDNMKMLDLARDPSTQRGLIPGFGAVDGSAYTFFSQLEDVPM